MSKYKRLASDTILFAISNFGSKLLTFLLTPLYTTILTTEQYGIADLIIVTINLIYPIFTLAISDAVLRYAFNKDISKSNVLNNSLLLVIFSSLILICGYPIVRLLSPELKEYWWFFIFTYVTFNIHNCISNFIKGLEKSRLFAIQGVIQSITIVICNIILLLGFKLGLKGYLLSIIIGYFVPTIVMLSFGNLLKYIATFSIDYNLYREMFKYSIPMISTILAWSVNTYIDKYMIIGVLGLSESGLYSVAHKIPTILTTMTMLFVQAWQLFAISNYKSKDESIYYTEIYSVYNLIGMLICMFIIPFSKMISSILFANAYFEAWIFIPMLMIAALFSSYAAFLASAFRASKRTAELSISAITGGIVNIVLNFLLINLIGTVGAAISTAISFTVIWVIRLITIQKIVKVKINALKTFGSYVLLYVISIVTILEINHYIMVIFLLQIIVLFINFPDLSSISNKLLQYLRIKLKSN